MRTLVRSRGKGDVYKWQVYVGVCRCVSVCVGVCRCVSVCVGVCRCMSVCAVSYTHLTLPTKRIVYISAYRCFLSLIPLLL